MLIKAHFLLYVFLLMTLLAVYFICILDYGSDIRQKSNLSDFLIAFSYCSSRSFAEETRALKTRSTVAGHWKLTMTN